MSQCYGRLVAFKKAVSNKSATNGDVEGNPTRVVNDVPVVEVLYDIENYFMWILKQWGIEMFTACP